MAGAQLSQCLIAIAVVACFGSAVQAQQPGTTAACAVEMRGSKASLSCSRGGITATADPSVKRQLQGSSAGKAAMTWTDGSGCGVEEGGTCLLTICGVQGDRPLDLQLVVANATGDPEQLWGIVCIAGNTKAVIKGAKITGNIVAGLVVDGSADVTITNSDFTENTRERYGGSALIAGGASTLRVADTRFNNNGHGDDETYGGIIVLKGSTQATFDSCSFVKNKGDYSQGGAVFAQEEASVKFTNSNFTANVAIYGGALHATGAATVQMSGCTLRENWASFGGAIYAVANATVAVVNSSMLLNYAQDHNENSPDGGAAYVYDRAVLTLNSTLIKDNMATSGRGGGVAMSSKSAVLRIGPGTRVTGNSARRGGGIYITRRLDNMAEVAPRIVGNTAAISNDVGSNLTQLEVLNREDASMFRPRLSENKALLPVRLRLTGPDGLPGAASIQAMLDNRLVGRGESSPVDGEVVLDVDLRTTPDTYTLQFSVVSLTMVNTSLTVTVLDCGPGETKDVGEQACNVCPRGSFSLNPAADGCSPCPNNAVCEKGAIVPVPGFWSSSLRSNQPHRCLYRPACSQTHSNAALGQYQNNPLSNATDAAFMAAQCAKGHEGALCGKCAKGFGQRMNALIGRCQPCASTASILILYFLAAVASMTFIRIMCFFNGIQQGGSALPGGKSSTRASQVLPDPLAAAGPSTSSAPSDAKQVREDLKAADSDAAMARGMPGRKDQLNGKDAASEPSPFVEAATSGPCTTCGRTCTCKAGDVQERKAGPNTSARVPVGDLLKPFTIYLQWMLVVATVNVQWPAAMAGPFLAVAWFFASSSTSTGLDCLLAQGQARLPLPVSKTLLGLFIPAALLAVLLCMDAISVGIRQAIRDRHHQQRGVLRVPGRVLPTGVFARTSIVLTFFFLPNLLRTVFSLFACVRLDSGDAAALNKLPGTFYKFTTIGRYWLLDVDQRCFEGYHRGWGLGLGIPLLLLLCVGVPFGIIGYLYVNRTRLREAYYLKHYGFLYVTYRPNRYYWEGVMAMQTCVVVAISVFGATLGAAFQCILLTAACGIAQTLLGVFKPFAYREANLVSMQAFACLVLSAQAALVFELLALTDADSAAAVNGVAAIVLVVNIVFVLSVLWRIVTAVDWAGLGGTAGSLGKAAAAKLSGCASGGSVGCLGGKAV